MPLPGSGGAWPSARHPVTTVTRLPRTFARPKITGGAPGIRVGKRRGRISRTVAASAAQASVPTRKTSSLTIPSLIRREEAKILQGVAFSKQIRIATRFRRARRANRSGHSDRTSTGDAAAYRVGERQERRMQRLPRRGGLEPLGGPPEGRRDPARAAEGVVAVPDHGMSHVRQVHPNLMRATRPELGPAAARQDRRKPRSPPRA